MQICVYQCAKTETLMRFMKKSGWPDLIRAHPYLVKFFQLHDSSKMLPQAMCRSTNAGFDRLHSERCWKELLKSFSSCTNDFYRTRVRSLAMLVTNSLTHWLTDSCLVNLIDVSLACEDGNSKLVEVYSATYSTQFLKVMKSFLSDPSPIIGYACH